MFFAHCTMRCLYCQNYLWSQQDQGRATSVDGLCNLLRDLRAQGAHNWNLVSPTPWWPFIEQALGRLKSEGIRLPVIYNSSGFESCSTLDRYADCFDVALVDLRYSRELTAMAASGCDGYVEAARETIKWFWRRLGRLRLDGEGTVKRGVICRILVLPGHAEEAVESLRWLRDNLGNGVAVSLMSQYTPLYQAVAPPWNRQVSESEYAAARDALEELGFAQGWVQEAAEETPERLLGNRMEAN